MHESDDDWPQLPLEDQARWWKDAGAHELRQILYWVWDPIGISDVFPNTADEYDSYLGGVVGLLKRNATEDEIAERLREIETDTMGLPGRRGDKTRASAAQQLRYWYPASIKRWQSLRGLTP